MNDFYLYFMGSFWGLVIRAGLCLACQVYIMPWQQQQQQEQQQQHEEEQQQQLTINSKIM